VNGDLVYFSSIHRGNGKKAFVGPSQEGEKGGGGEVAGAKGTDENNRNDVFLLLIDFGRERKKGPLLKGF